MASQASNPYVFGSNETEHLRLVRQARLLEPVTERLFRDAGIGHGMRSPCRDGEDQTFHHRHHLRQITSGFAPRL
jgi:hypothetical protein